MRLARLLSIRAMVLSVVLLVGFFLLFPTVRAYLTQRAELEQLHAEVVAAEERQEELAADLARWEDPAYVQAQARTRLSFVLPGETAYRVIDPELVVEEPTDQDSDGPLAGPSLPVGGAETPWYTTIWESMRVVGELDLADPAGVDPAESEPAESGPAEPEPGESESDPDTADGEPATGTEGSP